MQPCTCNISVGKNQLVAFQVSHTCGFYAYLFNSTGFIIYHHVITYFKRLVKNDGKIAEQIPQNILCCQSNGNTTNPHTGYQGSYIVTKIIRQKYNTGNRYNHIDDNDEPSCLFSFTLVVILRINIGIN